MLHLTEIIYIFVQARSCTFFNGVVQLVRTGAIMKTITLTIGVMNSTRNEGILSRDGQKECMKLISNPLMWEPS